MVYVEGGKLTLGSDEDENNQPHKVELDSFYISKYEVTQKLYSSVTGENPSKFTGRNRPVEQISWYDAVEFCNKLSLKEGLTPCYKINKNKKDPGNTNEYDNIKWTVTCNFIADGYRLPTEAEWEYAARGGQESSGYEYAGSNDIDEVAWYDDNSQNETHDVGEKAPNELGLYDMSGNVWEWCWDWREYELHGGKNPTGAASGDGRVARGGCWYNYAGLASVSFRGSDFPNNRDSEIGFRVCRNAN